MVPTPDELIALNPSLAARPREELQRLIDTIVASGWTWDTRSRSFTNDTLHTGLRTQGLDLFTPETFTRHHAEMMSNPKAQARHARGVALLQRWGTTGLALFLLDLLFGRLVFPLKGWLLSLLVVVVGLVLLIRYARAGSGIRP